jgi:hypothetical protein
MSNQNAPPSPGLGHKSGDYQSAIMSADEKRAFITSQIQLWVGYQRLDAALKAEELGQLSMVEKMVSLRNGLIVAAIRHCRLNPRADSRMSVYILICWLADNNDGICRLSVTAMCEIFQRSREAIVSAIKKLEEQGQIGVSRVGGMPNCYWPLIPAALAKMSGNPVWFVNALRISGPKATSSKPFGAATRNQSSELDQSSGVDQSAAELVNSSRPTRLVQPSSISSLISTTAAALPADVEDREARTDGAGATDGRKALLKIANEIKERILKEASGRFFNTASANLEDLSDIVGWLQNGADPELDIVPAIGRKLAYLRKRNSRQRIHSWHYFSQVVAEAKGRREKPLPTVDLGNGAARDHGKAERPRRTNTTYITEPDGNDDLLGGGR